MKTFQQSALLLCFLLISPAVLSADFQTAVGFQQHQVKVASSAFNTNAITARAGMWIDSGIGLELGLSLPLSSESEEEVSVKLGSLVTAGFRLESPLNATGYSAFFLAGIANAQLEGESTAARRVSAENFTGPYVGIGLSKLLRRNLLISLDYVQHTIDESISIPSLHMGFRYPF